MRKFWVPLWVPFGTQNKTKISKFEEISIFIAHKNATMVPKMVPQWYPECRMVPKWYPGWYPSGTQTSWHILLYDQFSSFWGFKKWRDHGSQLSGSISKYRFFQQIQTFKHLLVLQTFKHFLQFWHIQTSKHFEVACGHVATWSQIQTSKSRKQWVFYLRLFINWVGHIQKYQHAKTGRYCNWRTIFNRLFIYWMGHIQKYQHKKTGRYCKSVIGGQNIKSLFSSCFNKYWLLYRESLYKFSLGVWDLGGKGVSSFIHPRVQLTLFYSLRFTLLPFIILYSQFRCTVQFFVVLFCNYERQKLLIIFLYNRATLFSQED